MEQVSHPRKQPRQARAQATFDAILEASARILTHGGPDALTTNFVAKTAGVSVGSLYQYFPSKDAIIAELIRAMRQSMRDDIIATVAFCADRPLRFSIARLVRAVIHHHTHANRRIDVLEHLELHLPPDPQARQMRDEMRGAIAQMLARHHIPQPDQAASDLLNLVFGMAHPALHDGETNFDALAHRIEPAALGYLGILS